MTRDRTGRIRDFLLLPGDGLLLVDRDGRVSHIDETARRQLGSGSAALLGQPLAQHWSALAAVIERHRHSLASQGPLEEQLPRGQGRLHLRLFRTDDGVGVGLLHEPTGPRGDSGPDPLLALLLQQVRDALLVSRVTGSDPPGAVILYANEAALRQSGYERRELLGRSPALLLGPQTDPQQRERLAEARRRGEPLSLELIQHHRDGTPYWVECDETPLPLEGIEGGVRVIVQRDVTLRHRQEEVSRRQAEDYRVLAENANAVIFRARPDGVTLWVSDSITALTGWRPEELTGLPFAGFVHPDDLEMLRQTDAAFLRGEGVSCEFRVRCRSGHHRWVAMQGRGVQGSDGQVKELVGGWRDIEAHKQAELQLAASEEQLRLTFEHAAIGMGEATESGILLAVNPAFCHFVERTANALLGSPWQELLHPEERAALDARLLDLLARPGRDVQQRLRWLRSDGEVIWGDVALSCSRDGTGAVQRVYVQVLDSSQEVRAQLELRQQRDLLHATLDTLLDPHLLLTPIRRGNGVIDDFLISSVNAAACRSHCVSHRQLMGRTLRIALPNQSTPPCWSNTAGCSKPGFRCSSTT